MNKIRLGIIISFTLACILLESIIGALLSNSDERKLTVNDFLILNKKIEEGIGLAISSPFTTSI